MQTTLAHTTAIAIALVGCTALTGVGDLRSVSEAPDGGTNDTPRNLGDGGPEAADGEGGRGSDGPDEPSHALGVGDVRLFAGRTGAVFSRTRRAGRTAWSPAVEELTVDGTPRFLIPLLDPKTSEESLAIQYENDTGSFVEVRRRSASGEWVTEVTTPPMPSSHAAKRTFAIAKETSSGDLLLVYSKAGARTPAYRTRTADGWSPETLVPVDGDVEGSVLWIELASHPRTDEITLVFSTSDYELYAHRWDGSAWPKASFIRLENDLNSVELPAFAVAYEATSGDVIVAWGQDRAPTGPYITGWSTRTAGSPTFAPPQTIENLRPAGSMRAVAEPGSDRVAFVWLEDSCGSTQTCDDFVAAIWSGSAFVVGQSLDSEVGATYKTRKGSMPVGVGWFQGTAVGVYAGTNPTTEGLRWVHWTGGPSWTAPAIAPMTPPLGDQVSYAALTLPSQILFVVADLDHLWAKSYGSTGWANADEGAPLFDFGVSAGVPFALLTP